MFVQDGFIFKRESALNDSEAFGKSKNATLLVLRNAFFIYTIFINQYKHECLTGIHHSQTSFETNTIRKPAFPNSNSQNLKHQTVTRGCHEKSLLESLTIEVQTSSNSRSKRIKHGDQARKIWSPSSG